MTAQEVKKRERRLVCETDFKGRMSNSYPGKGVVTGNVFRLVMYVCGPHFDACISARTDGYSNEMKVL